MCEYCVGVQLTGTIITEDKTVIVNSPSQEIKKYYCPSKMQENSSSFKSSPCSLTNYCTSCTSNPSCNWNC